MAGALNMAVRQRFKEGGEAEAPASNPEYEALLSRILQTAAPQQPQARPAQGQLPTPPVPPEQTGALNAQAATPQNADPEAENKLSRIQQAMAVLQAGGIGGQTGGINIPLLAASGAMLAPTRTGNFAESLGNAFTTGAGALAQQRERDAVNALRAEQVRENALYRQGMLGVQGTRANAYAQNQDSLAWWRQRMVELKSQGLDDAAAAKQALVDARIHGIDTRAIVSLMGQDRRSEDIRYGADLRADASADRLAAQQAQWLKSNDAAAERARLQKLGIDSRIINSAVLAASRDIQVMTGKKKPGDVVDQYVAEARRQIANSPSSPPAAPASSPQEAAPAPSRAPTPNELAGAKKAIEANPANRAIVLQRFKAAGITPPPDL